MNINKEKENHSWYEDELDRWVKYQTDGSENDLCNDLFIDMAEALKKAMPVLTEGQSGMSIYFVKNLVDNLICHKPLTPVEGKDDEWRYAFTREDNKAKVYQNSRYTALFKDVNEDGTVVYSDVDRVICYDDDNIPYHSGHGDKTVDKLFPITLPYSPLNEKYKVYCDTFLYNKDFGDFDTRKIKYVITPDKKKIKVNQYFCETKDGWKKTNWFVYIHRKLHRCK